jgi:hypothetical protein
VRVLEDVGALDPPRIRGERGLAVFLDALRCVFAKAHDEVRGVPLAHALGSRGLDRSLQVRGQRGHGDGHVRNEVGTLPAVRGRYSGG